MCALFVFTVRNTTVPLEALLYALQVGKKFFVCKWTHGRTNEPLSDIVVSIYAQDEIQQQPTAEQHTLSLALSLIYPCIALRSQSS